MAYVIHYRSRGKKKYPRRILNIKNQITLLFCVGVLIVVIGITAHHGGFLWMVPGDPDVTAPAFTEFMNALSDGDSFEDAVTAFCREVIHGVQ